MLPACMHLNASVMLRPNACPPTRTAPLEHGNHLPAVPHVRYVYRRTHRAEFYALFNVAVPGLLGEPAVFRRTYELPILRGQDSDATDAEVCVWRGPAGRAVGGWDGAGRHACPRARLHAFAASPQLTG